MTNNKTIFVRKTAMLTLPLLGYLFASVFQLRLWGYILSPINALVCSGILLFAYLRSAKGNFAKSSLLLYSLAALAWGVADIVWAVMGSQGNDPASSPMIWVLYAIPNLFIMLALLTFAVKQFSKWNFVQICIDALIIGLMFMVFIWIVYLDKDASIFQIMMQSDFTSLFSIISDIVILTGVFLWFLSIRSGKIPRYIIIIACGAILFALSDMLYYYIDFRGLYIPNSFIDFTYALSLYVMAFGALIKVYKSSTEFDAKSFNNVGLKSRWGYLLSFPILTVLLDVAGVAHIDLNFMDMATFMILILLYLAFSRYVQLSIENDRLLQIQTLNNDMLERRVAEQVRGTASP
jgi:hypothetical protein